MKVHSPLVSVCVYVPTDEHFKKEITPYIRALNHKHLITEPNYIPAQTLDKDVILNADVVFLLQSMDLLNSRLNEVTDSLKTSHKLKRLILIPILLKNIPDISNPFKNIDTFLNHYEAIESNKWTSRYEAYSYLIDKVERPLQEMKAYKIELEECWEKVKKLNTVDAFGKFLQKYPNSRYDKEARKRRSELEEDDLWKAVEKRNDVKAYIHYLTYTSLYKHQFEASRRIYHIENNEALAWQEIEQLQHLELTFHYKNKYAFLKTANFHKADDLIESKLKDYKKIDQLNMDKLNTVYLDALIYEKLEKEEIFACLTYQELINILRGKLHYFFNKIINKHQDWAYISTLSFALALIMGWVMYFPKEDYEDWVMLKQFTFWVFFLTPVFVVSIKIILWHYFIRKDRYYMEKIEKLLVDFSILIKVYLIKRDQEAVKTIVTTLHTVDKGVNFINIKTFWHYMDQLKDHTGIELQRQLNILRLKKILPYPEEIEKIDNEYSS